MAVAARRESKLESLVAGIAGEGAEAAALAGDVQSEDFARARVDLAARRFAVSTSLSTLRIFAAKWDQPQAYPSKAGTTRSRPV